VSGYISFSSFIISLIVHLACATVQARFIHILHCMIVDSPFIFIFFYCVYNSYTHLRSFAALQHLNFAGISLKFYIYWHMVAWIVDISMDILHIFSGFMDSLHITTVVNKGLQVSMMLIIACCDCTCMLCIMINMWFLKFHGLYKLYTHVFPFTK